MQNAQASARLGLGAELHLAWRGVAGCRDRRRHDVGAARSAAQHASKRSSLRTKEAVAGRAEDARSERRARRAATVAAPPARAILSSSKRRARAERAEPRPESQGRVSPASRTNPAASRQGQQGGQGQAQANAAAAASSAAHSAARATVSVPAARGWYDPRRGGVWDPRNSRVLAEPRERAAGARSAQDASRDLLTLGSRLRDQGFSDEELKRGARARRRAAQRARGRQPAS